MIKRLIQIVGSMLTLEGARDFRVMADSSAEQRVYFTIGKYRYGLRLTLEDELDEVTPPERLDPEGKILEFARRIPKIVPFEDVGAD